MLKKDDEDKLFINPYAQKRKERICLHKKRFGVVNFSSFWQFYSYFCKWTPFSGQKTFKN
jgi:hypothetical protein